MTGITFLPGATLGFRGQSFLQPTAIDFDSLGTTDSDNPDYASMSYRNQQKRWELLEDLLGGTLIMRKRGRKWLPALPQEEDKAYVNRLSGSFLFEAYKKTLNKLASLPFKQDVALSGNCPEWLMEFKTNVNREGHSITQFCGDLLWNCLHYGHGVILGEAPVPGDEQFTLQDQQDLNLFPYLISIPASRIIGWTSDVNRAGQKVVTEMRIYEQVVVKKGAFGEEAVQRVRHIKAPLDPGNRDIAVPSGEQQPEAAGIDIWERTSSSGWTIARSLPYDLRHPQGGIPVFPFYSKYLGTLESEPPLEPLGWLNLEHWQSASQQRNILQFIRSGVLFLRGFSEEDLECNLPLVISPTTLLVSDNKDADARWVEHNGSAAQFGRQDIIDIEAKMERFGLQILTENTADAAVGAVMNQQGSTSHLQQMVRNMENAMLDAIKWVSSQRNEDLPSDIMVNAKSEFDVPMFGGSNRHDVLIKSRENGDISREDYINELKRDGTISPSLDTQSVVRRAVRDKEDDIEMEQSGLREEVLAARQLRRDGQDDQPAEN